MKASLRLGLVAMGMSAAIPAYAVTGTVDFTANILPSCAILLTTPGVLDLSADGRVLSTLEGRGVAASATLLATGANFKFNMTTPTAFIEAPAASRSDVTFESRYSASGVTLAVDVTAGTATTLSIGTSILSMQLTARRPAGFSAGPYLARSTITCE
ncbi:MAG: hypothetical protein INR68_15705 [Methylobacterium mesophilicum]|nr:hypothetical protein [Methylobacterium mesophilicum]